MLRRLNLSRLVLGLVPLGLLVIMDFAFPTGRWYGDHPMTASAIATIFGFVAAGIFLEEWVREREAARLRRISTVAYRSLAQSANDAGRRLLAPLVGADLYALAIPGATRTQAREDAATLRGLGHVPAFEERGGSWSRLDGERLDPVLRDRLHQHDFVERLFRDTSLSRRKLQDATAQWAPVMLISFQHSTHLSRMRDLSDALELLQEHVREAGIGIAHASWAPTEAWLASTCAQFWTTVRCYEAIRDEFGDLAELPSDDILGRRRTRASGTS